MGFKNVKSQVLACLASGNIQHEQRQTIDVKNLLVTGQVSEDDVSDIIARAKGTEYELSKHHVISAIDVHILKTHYRGKNWYIKWYFIEPDSIFISVHH
ncbi:hypothetical protein L0668_14715 [Paraglaciecola aquimarina]|uniref:DUF4258 domain-containing protein n=1 Tax=Paraglaciecola algarum TaxID=3050085 RepID=A0ABS9D9G2_9ALTE|nr:hypothetical protein [Paraglaciecola sp. G1-23]MCF2949369.1 hypothetical protein [Paraglaciecola sp. G1-23]